MTDFRSVEVKKRLETLSIAKLSLSFMKPGLLNYGYIRSLTGSYTIAVSARACAVKIWPKILVNASESPKYCT